MAAHAPYPTYPRDPEDEAPAIVTRVRVYCCRQHGKVLSYHANAVGAGIAAMKVGSLHEPHEMFAVRVIENGRMYALGQTIQPAVEDASFDLAAYQRQRLRESGLAKLSAAEREALDLEGKS